MSELDSNVMEMRPRLLFDVQFHKEADGVSFRRRNVFFKVDGTHSYRAMMSVVSHLTGERRLSEICEQLDPACVDATVGLVRQLSARGFVVPRVEEVTDLTESDRQRFAPQIEFIGQFIERPLKRFERFRNSRLLVAGSGPAARAVVLALARNGARGVLCDGQLSADALESECQRSSPEFRIETIAVDAALLREDSRADVLCYASDTPDLAAVAKLSAACARRSIPFIPGVMLTGRGFVGPLCGPSGRPCWFCLFLRRAENVSPGQSAAMWKSLALEASWHEDRTLECSQSSQILGNLVAFETFKLLAGHLPVEIDGHVLTFDLESLECGRSRLLPHPSCPRCASASSEKDRSYLAAAAAATEAPRLPIPARLRQVSVLAGADLGILDSAIDDTLPQTPLFQACAHFRERDSGEAASAFGYSLHSYGDARLMAVRAAVRHYCASRAVAGRIWRGSATDAMSAGHPVIRGSRLSTCLARSGTLDSICNEWMHARSPENDTVCLVPAAAVYSLSSPNRGMFEATAAGTGVGRSFKDACRDAINSAIACESLKQLATGRIGATRPALASMRSSAPDLQMVMRILETLHVEYRVITVTCAGVTVATAFSPGSATDARKIAVGADTRPASAIVAALVDLTAIADGGVPSRTLDYYLPAALGYRMEVCELERRCGDDAPDREARLGGILIANLSTDDIELAELRVVKALVLEP